LEALNKLNSLMLAVGGPVEVAVVQMLRKMLCHDVRLFITPDEVVEAFLHDHIERRTESGSEELLFHRSDAEMITDHIARRAESHNAREIKVDFLRQTFWVRYLTGRKVWNLFIALPGECRVDKIAGMHGKNLPPPSELFVQAREG
jgi:hypothetical protein